MSQLKDKMKKIAEETVEISKKGQYNFGKSLVCFNTNSDTTLFENKDFEIVHDFVTKMRKCKDTTQINVVNEGSVDGIFRLGEPRKDKYNNCANLGVLNFASAYQPGGGFLNGSMAQEECLSYCSDLYIKLLSNEGPKFYEINKKNKSKLYTNTMIASDVTFFRNSNFELVSEPLKVWVVTAPAVNMGQIILHNESVKQANAIMKNRMRKILYLFSNIGCTDLILGAFGCGVFGNKAEDVATFWYELLIEEGLKKYFDSITFSVIDKNTNNFKVFKEKLE